MELAKISLRIMADTSPPIPPEACYVFAELPQNAPSAYAAASRAATLYTSMRVLVTSEDGTRCRGFSGKKEMIQGLTAAGVPASRVDSVPFAESETLIHTLNESQFLVRYCKKRGYRRVLVTAPPFHHLRAFMTVLSAAKREYPELNLFSLPGLPQNWTTERVVHSQGVVTGSREELLDSELERILRYTQKGDIAPAADLLKLLHLRDMRLAPLQSGASARKAHAPKRI